MWQRDGVTAYREMNGADRATFRRWLLAHAVIGALSVVALIAVVSMNKGGGNEVASEKQPIQHAAAH